MTRGVVLLIPHWRDDPAFLSAPSLLLPAHADILSDYTPDFSWTTVEDADEYEIQIATDAGFTNIIATDIVASPTFTPSSPLPYYITLYWRVRAISGGTESAWSSVRSFGLWLLYDQFLTLANPAADLSPHRRTWAGNADAGADRWAVCDIGWQVPFPAAKYACIG